MDFTLYEQVFAKANRAAHYFGLDTHWAEDVAIDLLPQVPPEPSEGWFHVALRRAAIRKLQRDRRCTNEFPLWRAEPVRVALWDVESRLERESPETLAMLWMWLAGFEYTEIGRECGQKPDAVRMRLNRALRAVRADLTARQNAA